MHGQNRWHLIFAAAAMLTFHVPSIASAAAWDDYVDNWRDARQGHGRFEATYYRGRVSHDYDDWDRTFYDPVKTYYDRSDSRYDPRYTYRDALYDHAIERQDALRRPWRRQLTDRYDVGSYYRYGPAVDPEYPTYGDVYQDDDGFRDDAARQMDGYRRWTDGPYPRTRRWGLGPALDFRYSWD